MQNMTGSILALCYCITENSGLALLMRFPKFPTILADEDSALDYLN